MQSLSLTVSCSTSASLSEKQETLWQNLFSNPAKWWDNRPSKRGPFPPDFRKKSSKEPLWLNSRQKPDLVDARFAALDQRKIKQQTRSVEGLQISQEIERLCNDGQLDRALSKISHFNDLDSAVPLHVYLSLLKASARSKSLFHVQKVCAYLQQKHVKLSGSVGNYLAISLAKCGSLNEAWEIFDNLPSRSLFSWTAMIRAHVEYGHYLEALRMYDDMQIDGVNPDNRTFVSLLKACSHTRNLDKGKELHDVAREKGFTSDTYVRTTLVSMYCNCGAISDAENVLCESNKCNIESANAMLSAYVANREPKKALFLFRQLQEEGVEADEVTYNVSLLACNSLADSKAIPLSHQLTTGSMLLEISQMLHADSKKRGLSMDTALLTTLIKVYGKHGTIRHVENVFQSLSKHDIVSWSAVLSAYVEHGFARSSLQLFRRMQELGLEPDCQAFSIAFQACASLAEGEGGTVASCAKALEIGKALHLDARKKGFTSDVFLGNTMMSMYGKCRDIVSAESVFEGLPKRDTVSWNSLLSSYIEQGMEEKALRFYLRMEEDCAVFNEVTLLCALQSCSGTGCLEITRHIHYIATSVECESNPLFATALIHAYSMCASIADAISVLNKCSEDDIVFWNACLAGCSREGDHEACLRILKNMQEKGIKPDRITVCLMISVCAHAGLIEDGVGYFESMSRCYGITQDLTHYVNLADLFARAGDFERLELVLCLLPMQPDSDLWLCVAAACRSHGNMQFGKWAFDWAVHPQFESSGAFVLLSNTFVDAD